MKLFPGPVLFCDQWADSIFTHEYDDIEYAHPIGRGTVAHGEDSGRQQSSMDDADSDTDAGTALRGGTPSSSNATSTSTTANTVARLIDKYYMYLCIYLYNMLNNLLLVSLYSSLSIVSRRALVCRLLDVT